MERIINNLEEMEIWANSFVKNLSNNSEKALIIGLFGDLGSGKTTFVQNVAKSFGIKNQLTSPTFVIQKKYKIDDKKFNFRKLIHIDAYRLEKGEDLLNLDWQEVEENPENIIFIEWPEKIIEVLPENMKKISFKFVDGERREISYKN